MTTVIFRVARDTITGIEPSRRTVVATPTRARWEGATFVIPDEVRFQMPVVGEATNVILEPTGPTWAWKITYPGQRPITVLVPESDNPIEAADLVQVDPATLEPDATPDPTWWAALDSQVIDATVTDGNLVFTRQNGGTIVAGNVQGPPGPALTPDPDHDGFMLGGIPTANTTTGVLPAVVEERIAEITTDATGTRLDQIAARTQESRGESFASALRTKKPGTLRIGLGGDSTGNNGDEWFEAALIALGQRDATLGTEINRWVSGSNSYGTTAVLQAGDGTRKITAYNASISGSALAAALPHLAAMFPVPLDVVFISSSHNYGAQTTAQYSAALDAYIKALKIVQPEASIILSSQNPEKSPATTPYSITAHLARLVFLRDYAARHGYGYLPVVEAFLDTPNWEALVQADGIHPTVGYTNTGSSLWRDVALAYLDDLGVVASKMTYPGRGPGQWWFSASPTGTHTGHSAAPQDRAIIHPTAVHRETTLSALGIDISAAGEAGSVVRLAVYADSGEGGPGRLIAETAPIAASALGVVSGTVPEVKLTPGIYWCAAVQQLCATTPPGFKRLPDGWAMPVQLSLGSSLPASGASMHGFQASGISGAFPATWPGGGNTTYAPRMLLRRGL